MLGFWRVRAVRKAHCLLCRPPFTVLAGSIAQRVQEEAQCGRVADVEAVSSTGGVEIVRQVPIDEAVVGRVVDTFHR